MNDSLLVLVADRDSPEARASADRIVIDGPTRVTANLALSPDGVVAIRVKPGTYTLRSRSLWWPVGLPRSFNGYSNKTVVVRAATIVLPTWKFREIAAGDAGIADSLGPVTPADRRKAATFLVDDVGTSEWAGRNVAGFAPYNLFTDYVSTAYDVDVRSTPSDSGVEIDREDWGRTPVTAKLPAGRHFIRLSHPGYADVRAFIDVERNRAESFVLKPLVPGEIPSGGYDVPLMIEPFRNLDPRGSRDLSPALTSSLDAALKKEGVQIVDAAAPGSTAPAARPEISSPADASPDFASAEKAGVEAFVAGEYLTSPDSILIHAALYDTRTRLVKTSLLFNGMGGLDIFNSIDLMSAKFGASLEKVLPEVGQAVVQERAISPEGIAFGRRLARQEIIAKRNAHKYAISVGPSEGYVADLLNPPGTNNDSRINGPTAGLYMGFDAPIEGALSLHLATAPFLFSDVNHAWKVEIPLYFGPRLTFSGYMSDIFFGLQGAVHFAPPVTYWSKTGSIVSQGPFLLSGANLETGVRIYTYRNTTKAPSFVEIGMALGAVGYRFDLSGASSPLFYPMEIGLHVLWGTRL